jgi:hypothetical protein
MGDVPERHLPEPVPGLLRPPKATVPKLDPSEMAEAAIKLYDKNGDSKIAGEELSPALKASLSDNTSGAPHDANGDRAYDKEELESRLKAYLKDRIPFYSVICEVSLDGNPLEGATVTYTPEPFLGPEYKAVSGKSDAQGIASLTPLPPGIYRVTITKDAGGKETLLETYNTKTTLGQELAVGLGSFRGATVQYLLKGPPKPK